MGVKIFVILALLVACGAGIPGIAANHEDEASHERHGNHSAIEPRFFYGKFIPFPGVQTPGGGNGGGPAACVPDMATCCKKQCPVGQTCPTAGTPNCAGGSGTAQPPMACLNVPACAACTTFTTCTPAGSPACTTPSGPFCP